MSEITLMLQAVERGEKKASEELLPLVYEELRRLAASRMARQPPGHTLQATALVHEAWLRLTDENDRSWEGRAHFFGAAAVAMRQILVEKARRKARLKHGGGQQPLNIDDLQLAQVIPDERILQIHEALEQLEAEYPERSRIVVLKYFSGLTNKEVAGIMGIGERSVDRHWACAKIWLMRQIETHG